MNSAFFRGGEGRKESSEGAEACLFCEEKGLVDHRVP
jgi:hypothetical protein